MTETSINLFQITVVFYGPFELKENAMLKNENACLPKILSKSDRHEEVTCMLILYCEVSVQRGAHLEFS